MGKRGGVGKRPSWYRGKKVACDICGFPYYEEDGKLFKQRGLMVDRACYETLTDKERAESIARRRS